MIRWKAASDEVGLPRGTRSNSVRRTGCAAASALLLTVGCELIAGYDVDERPVASPSCPDPASSASCADACSSADVDRCALTSQHFCVMSLSVAECVECRTSADCPTSKPSCKANVCVSGGSGSGGLGGGGGAPGSGGTTSTGGTNGSGGTGGTGTCAASMQRYTVSNFTVADGTSGLVWQQNVPDQGFTWADAEAYCQALALDGGGWHLPTRDEIIGIRDTNFYPYVDPCVFPAWKVTRGSSSNAFWTSTPDAADSTKAYFVSFTTDPAARTTQKTFTDFSVRCVR